MGRLEPLSDVKSRVGNLEESVADLMRGVSELLLRFSLTPTPPNGRASVVDTGNLRRDGSPEPMGLLQQRVDTLEASMTNLKKELTARMENHVAQVVVTNRSLNKLQMDLANLRSGQSSPPPQPPTEPPSRSLSTSAKPLEEGLGVARELQFEFDAVEDRAAPTSSGIVARLGSTTSALAPLQDTPGIPSTVLDFLRSIADDSAEKLEELRRQQRSELLDVARLMKLEVEEVRANVGKAGSG